MHEPDRAGVGAVPGELAAQVLIGVPAALAAGGAEVAEDDLEAARDGQQVPVAVVVAVAAVLMLDPGDVLRGHVEFPGLRRPQPGQPRVQRGQPPVVGDLEHVVFVGQDRAAAHGLSTPGQVLHESEQFSDGSAGTTSGLPPASSGTGSLRSSLVLTSAATRHMFSSSGMLRNRANRSLTRMPPSGATSTSVVVAANVPTQASKSSMPASASRSGRR